MTYLLDTNIVSELTRSTPDPTARARLRELDQDQCYLSVVVLGELRRGVELKRRRDPHQAAVLDSRLAIIEDVYRSRIVPVDHEVADRWGRLMVPDPMPAFDTLLAATALVHDWTVVTRNVKDFQRTGVRLLNPFSS